MQILWEKLQKYSHWLVFLILEAVSVTLLIQFNNYHSSVWFTQANAVAGQILSWEQQVIAYTQLGEENAVLTQRNIVLEHNLDVMRQKLVTATGDSSYTQMKVSETIQGMRLIPGHVINNSIMSRDNLITIDRGSKDGVRPEMGVVSGTGIVGIVAQVSENYCLVQSILNSKSSISCRLRDTNYFGYLRWDGVSPIRMVLDDIALHARFRIGDVVETSGFSKVFPAGIFVGRVIKIRNSNDGLSYQLVVRLGTDIARLRDVNIIGQENKMELDSLSAGKTE